MMMILLSLPIQNQREVFGNNYAYDGDDSLPSPVLVPEGAPPAAPNIDAGPRRSTREKRPIDRFVPGANNI